MTRKEYLRQWYLANRDKIREKRKTPEEITRQKAWAKIGRERKKAQNPNWFKEDYAKRPEYFRNLANSYRKKHLPKMRQQARDRYAASAEKRRAYDRARWPKRKAWKQSYDAKNKERISQWNKAYQERRKDYFKKAYSDYEKLPERKVKKRAYNAQYRKENAEMVRTKYKHLKFHYKSTRKAREVSPPEEIDAITEMMRLVKSAAASTCSYCGRDVPVSKIHFDHILPLARGGRHEVKNLCVSCPTCNLSKKDKTPEEFLEYRKVVGI